jgi:hypothetical protein
MVLDMCHVATKITILQPLVIMIIAVFVCIGSGGCVSIYNRNRIDQIPDRTNAITSSRMDSGMVKNMIGDPRISSRYWEVEVFREATSHIDVAGFIAIPVGMQKDDIYRYTLVSYNKDKSAESAVTGILRKPRVLVPIETENLTLFLQTGDFTFVIEERDKLETLLVKPARRNTYLHRARSSPQCTAIVGCISHACPSALRVDNGISLPIPYGIEMTIFDQDALKAYQQGKLRDIRKTYDNVRYDSIAAVSLMPGAHTLEFSEGRWQEGGLSGTVSGRQSISFACLPGEIRYLVIQVSAKELTRFGSKDVEWRIDLQNDMPELFSHRDLVIYRGDKWILNPESEN